MPKEAGDKFRWTDDSKEFVRQHYGKPGYTGQSIADRLGCSREAVIGQASRLGLTRAFGSGRTRAPVERKGPASLGKMGLAQTSQDERSGGLGLFKAVPLREVLIDVSGYQCAAVPDIVALGPHQCRWPLDAGGFCGNDKYRGDQHKDTSYCLTHLRVSVSATHYRGGYWATRK